MNVWYINWKHVSLVPLGAWFCSWTYNNWDLWENVWSCCPIKNALYLHVIGDFNLGFCKKEHHKQPLNTVLYSILILLWVRMINIIITVCISCIWGLFWTIAWGSGGLFTWCGLPILLFCLVASCCYCWPLFWCFHKQYHSYFIFPSWQHKSTFKRRSWSDRC